VCPWNQKVYKGLFDPLQLIKNYSYEQLSEEMCWILSASNSQLKARFINTPLSRAGSFGLRRNAMLVAAHYELKTTMGLLSAFYNHPKLGELARWTFELLNRQSSRDKTAASTCSDLGNEIGQT
jgi:epoxyqueuosine reductase